MVNILNRCEIPHHLELHNKRILCTARHPYDILTADAQRINPTYGQTSLQRTNRSRTTDATYGQTPLQHTDRSRTMNVQPDVPMTY